MKKMIGLLVFLFVFYFGMQILFVVFGKGHEVEYELNSGENVVSINEKYNSNGKDEDNYVLNISVDDTVFDYITYTSFNKSSEIVKEVEYFTDDIFKCIFVKFKDDKILTDIICHNGEYVVPYHNIQNPTIKLQEKVTALSEKGYKIENWVDDLSIVQAHISLVTYVNNRVINHNISIAEDRKLYKMYTDGNITHKKIFSVSEPIVHGFVDNKYVSFHSNNNANAEYEIHSLTSNSEKAIAGKNDIGAQKILGSYEESIFIYDTTNKIEYELDLESENMLEIGSAGSKIKYYENGKWKYIEPEKYTVSINGFGSKYEVDYSNPEYVKIEKHGYENGYYYGYKAVGGNYQVYRSINADMSNKTYIFTTDNIDSVKFVDDYIYYMQSNIIKHYSDKSGNRTLLYFDGLNGNSIYNVFSEKK